MRNLKLNIMTITVLLITLLLAVYVAGQDSGTFTASASVGNAVPSITVDPGQSVTGQLNQVKEVQVFFNASDSNGNGDLNDGTAAVSINNTGEPQRNSTACDFTTVDADTKRYNCSVPLAYFDAAGNWTVNATIEDDQGSPAENSTETLTVNSLDGVQITQSSVSFSGAAGTDNVAASPQPQRLENTGNRNYSNMNITGYAFVNGTDTIGAGNVTLNISDSGGAGQQLINNTDVDIKSATLNRGNNSNQSVYFWLDVPSGTPSTTFESSGGSWTLTAWNITNN